ncbi:MAG: nitrous oxide reductase accessory protein NosL [Gracilimonas sp.]|uniref:nitrous oxide reductase accessory protein NosL n=1 Tax=Gracilimonas sp. TaxID=1974203 RepID=UPI00198374C6|nr:nitrous oxide reductase accessory protein NosL [Gracilimonas sp.]MBD3615040.1 nitrous oxide reductase accessory protein NosL [Gracilimonas sp.]
MIIALILLVGCSQEPVPIHYNSDECAHCKMMITDNQFAAQLVTDKGKAYKFDAIECMAVYYRENQNDLSGSRLWVSNYNKPGTWLDALEAQFVKSEVINSPMGESLLALPGKEAADEHVEDKPGRLLLWDEVSQTDMKKGTHR